MKILCVVVFIAALQAAGLAQTPQLAESRDCHISEVLNREGWEVPGLSKTTTTLKHSRWTTGGLTGVFVDILKSRAPDSSATLISCVADHPERVQVRVRAIRVKEILRFSIDGRVFAYRVTAQLMGIENTKTRVPLASETMFTLYDEDGSGRFTIMQYPGAGLIPLLDIPNWVKNGPK